MVDERHRQRQSGLRPGVMLRPRRTPKPAIWEHVFALAFERRLRELKYDPQFSIMYDDTHRTASRYARSVADLALSGVEETEGDGVFVEQR